MTITIIMARIIIIMIIIIIIIIVTINQHQMLKQMCTSTASAHYGNVDAPAYQSPGWHLWQVPATP